jgi:hypothetical protein
MWTKLLLKDWTPAYLRQGHPLVQRYLQGAGMNLYKPFIFGSSLILLLLFGGFGLPMLYFLLSLVLLVHLAAGTAYRIHHAREAGQWDLIRATPLSRREVLLSTWAAGVWQLRATWLLPLYRLLQAMILIGVLVLRLWVTEVPTNQATVLVLAVAVLIALKPSLDLYFSGMVGLMCAQLLPRSALAALFAGAAALLYWSAWLGGGLYAMTARPETLSFQNMSMILLALMVLPLVFGAVAQHTAENYGYEG